MGEYYGEIISKMDMTAENSYQGFYLGSAGSGGKIEPKKIILPLKKEIEIPSDFDKIVLDKTIKNG